jgi:hypothetical protein
MRVTNFDFLLLACVTYLPGAVNSACKKGRRTTFFQGVFECLGGRRLPLLLSRQCDDINGIVECPVTDWTTFFGHFNDYRGFERKIASSDTFFRAFSSALETVLAVQDAGRQLTDWTTTACLSGYHRTTGLVLAVR